ncbi:ATP-dependent DNA helicase RecG [Candidatus Wolfebacteria bacterium]|nr:MAG: ATP-dependent DNA helicase RecG [Candidatus Wolfebacteria bacterium]
MKLTSVIEDTFRLIEPQKKALKRLRIETIQDLLYYFPTRYSDISEIKNIKDVSAGESVTLYGQILKPKTKKAFRKRIPMAEATLEDLQGDTIKIIWFNQAYIAKMVKDGDFVKLTGKITKGNKQDSIYLSNPELEQLPDLPIDTHDTLFKSEQNTLLRPRASTRTHGLAYPIYRETRGLSSKWIYHTIQKIFSDGVLDSLEDPIEAEILKKYNLPTLSTALVWIHTPKKESDSTAARKRFAFEEVFFIQLIRQRDRLAYKKNKSFKVHSDKNTQKEFFSRFPFKATNAQENASKKILEDLSSNEPMSRLLEGDVGSGKTLVAALASYATIQTRPPKPAGEGSSKATQDFGNLQVAYMTPTEILASQQFESFIEYFKHLNINVGLITGSGCKKFPSKVDPSGWTTVSRPQFLKWVKNGEIPVVVGTHALIQKSVQFENLALVIIDEQHRFGVRQRSTLVRKDGFAPHFLSMTATPIPRTLALTIFGDLDLTLIDEMPKGRKEIITDVVIPTKREDSYDAIRKELSNRKQVYVICARIDEPDPDKKLALNLKSVTAESKRLKKEVFPEYEIDILHSKMTKDKKERVMAKFSKGDIDILVATSVIEVGVNVPNATVIIIEGAERFGLAQLHQLRGRVIRSNDQAYCYIFADTKTQKTIARLNAIKTAKNGFELSELDLVLRGAGELSGAKQWGITDIGMEAIKNIKMVEAARTEASAIIKKDSELKHYPLIKEILERKTTQTHFE